MKKRIIRMALFVALTTMMFAMTVSATEVISFEETTQETVKDEMPLIALGANLSPEQKQTVLSLMGVSEADLASYNVITITNDMEHQYLDSYIDPSVIGTKSLSSVMITPKEEGHGVQVTTQNISYCTIGMYRNALLTAGISDADILVVGPTQISGTAALIGAVKGYEILSGEDISDEKLDAALDEMITTGDLAAEIDAADSEDIEALIAYVKAKLAAGELETEADIRNAIEEGEAKFGVTLSDSEKQQIVDIMAKIKKLGLDPNVLINQAEDLYKKFGSDFINHIDGETIAKAGVSSFFSGIAQSVKGFFSKFFK